MSELAAALEATALAQFLKASRWIYPLVNAGHILGLALLVGAVVPMDLRLLGLRRGVSAEQAVALLRPVAAAGLALAATFGILLFITQAIDYVESPWFQAKMAVIAVALFNVLTHPRLAGLSPARRTASAAASLALWPTALLLGRLIAYT